jgi:site-specific recombinase XerD
MRVIPTPPPDTDVDLLTAFRRHLVARDLAPATVQAYLHDLARFHTWLAWVHEGTAPPLTQVRTVDLAAFRTYLIHEQAHTAATVNRRLQGLRLLFRWLSDCHWIPENPAAHLRFMRKSGTPQPPALNRREVFALVHAAAASPHGLAPRNVALVQLMLQAGLRVGEVIALIHVDLHLQARSGTVHVRDGKGRKARDIPLNSTVRRALQDYLGTLPEMSAQTPVFLSKRGTSLAVRSAQAVIARLAVQAGIQRIPVSAHTLRHTFAVHYLQRHPGKLRDLADLLGHASVDTTTVYTKPSQDDVAADLERSPLNAFDL